MYDHEKAENAFREEYLFTKEEVVASFKGYMDYIENGDDEDLSDAMRERRLELCRTFLDKLQKLHIPDQTGSDWFYEYNFEDTSIELILCQATHLICNRQNSRPLDRRHTAPEKSSGVFYGGMGVWVRA